MINKEILKMINDLTNKINLVEERYKNIIEKMKNCYNCKNSCKNKLCNKWEMEWHKKP